MTRARWAERLLAAASIEKPRGDGPFPLVMQFHGCGGLRPFQAVYAQRAIEAGYAVMTVDSFKPRGISRLMATLSVCTGLRLKGAERAADLYALYHWAKMQTWVEKRCIVAAGWSHGSWMIMDALAMDEDAPRLTSLSDLPAQPLHGLKGVVLVYPYAGFPAFTRHRGWSGRRPAVFALLAGKDQVVGTRFPRAAIARLERDGLEVDLLEFPDASHAFDDKGASDPRTVYRPDLVDKAVAWYGKALESLAHSQN